MSLLLSEAMVHLGKAAGQLACARDVVGELIPSPIEIQNRIAAMMKEAERMILELEEYRARNKM